MLSFVRTEDPEWVDELRGNKHLKSSEFTVPNTVVLQTALGYKGDERR